MSVRCCTAEKFYSTVSVCGIAAVMLSCGGSDKITSPSDPNAPAIVSLTDSRFTLEVGFSRQLGATVKSSDSVVLNEVAIVWSSDNPAVATVAAGTVDALAVGTATITATAGGKRASAVVTVIPTIAVSVRISPSSVALGPGRTLQLSAQAFDRLQRVIPGRALTFASANSSVADVTSVGLVTARDIGTTVVTVSADSARANVGIIVANPTQFSVRITAAAPAGLLQVSSYTVKIRQPADSLFAVTDVGAFGSLSGSLVLADTMEYVAEANGGTTWTSTIVAARTEMPASVPTVLIPRTVTLGSGTYAGVSVGISIMAALTPCGVPGGQCYSGFYPQDYQTGVKRWASYPIAVAIDATLDSAKIWDALRAMEASVGRPMFVVPDGTQGRYISVQAGLPPGITGFGGYTTWNWDANDQMTDATVWLARGFTRATVQHEFLHALGFVHTCSWLSVMGGYGCQQAPEISSTDVAYVQLANAVFDAESTFRLPNGALPCGEMGIVAAAENRRVVVWCDGDAWLNRGDFSRASNLSRSLSINPSSVRGNSQP